MAFIGTDKFDRIVRGDDPEERKRLRREQRALEAGYSTGIGNPPQQPTSVTPSVRGAYINPYKYLENLINEARSRAAFMPPAQQDTVHDIRKDLYDSSSVRAEQERIARLLFSKTKLFQGKDFESEYSNRDEFRKWLDTALVGGLRYFASSDDYRTFSNLLKEYDKLEKTANDLSQASKEEETRRSYLSRLSLAYEPPPVQSVNAPDILSDLRDDFSITVIPKDIFHVEGMLVNWKPNIRDLTSPVPANDYRKSDGFSLWGQDTSLISSVAQARYGTDAAYWITTLSEISKFAPREVRDPVSGLTVRYNDATFPEWGATVVLERLGYSPDDREYRTLRDELVKVYESVMLSEIVGLKGKTGATGVLSDEIRKIESKLPASGLYLVSGTVGAIETLSRELAALIQNYRPGLSPDERRVKLRELTAITGDPVLLKSARQRLADVALDGSLLAMTILAPYAGKAISQAAAPISRPFVKTAVTYLGYQTANTLPDIAAAMFYADAYGLSQEEKLKFLGTIAAVDILGGHVSAPARPPGLTAQALGVGATAAAGATVVPAISEDSTPLEGAALSAGSAASFVMMRRIARGVYGYVPMMNVIEDMRGSEARGRALRIEGERLSTVEPSSVDVVLQRFREFIPDGDINSSRGMLFRSLVWASGAELGALADDKYYLALKEAFRNAEERGIIGPDASMARYVDDPAGLVQLAHDVIAKADPSAKPAGAPAGLGVWHEAKEKLAGASEAERQAAEAVLDVFGKPRVTEGRMFRGDIPDELEIPIVNIRDIYNARGEAMLIGPREKPSDVNPRYWSGAANVVDEYWDKTWAISLSALGEKAEKIAVPREMLEEAAGVGAGDKVVVIGKEVTDEAGEVVAPKTRPVKRSQITVVERVDVDINGNPIEGPVHVRYKGDRTALSVAKSYVKAARDAAKEKLKTIGEDAVSASRVPIWLTRRVSSINWTNIDVSFVKEMYNYAASAKDLLRQAADDLGKPSQSLTKRQFVNWLKRSEQGAQLVRSYEALTREVNDIYRYLVNEAKARGIKIRPITETSAKDIDAYMTAGDMMVSVRKNKELRIGKYRWWHEHPLLGYTTLRKLQAIKDYYGHNLMGVDYSIIGHENAWNFIRHLFSEEAQQALAIETRVRPAEFFYHGGMTVWENPAKLATYRPKVFFLDRKFWDDSVPATKDSAISLAVKTKPRSRIVAPDVEVESTAAGVMQVGGMPPKPPSKAPPRGEPGHGFERYRDSFRQDGIPKAISDMDNRLAYSNEFVSDKHYIGRVIAELPVMGRLAKAINPALDFTEPHEKAVLSGVLAHANYMRESALSTAQLMSGIMKTLQPVLGIPLRYTLASKGSAVVIPALEVLVGYALSESTGSDIYRDISIFLAAGTAGFTSEAAKRYQWRFSNLSRIPVLDSAPDVVKNSKDGARFALIIEDFLRHDGSPRWFVLTQDQLAAIRGYIDVLNGLIEDANTWRVAANMKPIPKADIAYGVFVKPSDRDKILKIGGGAAGIRGKILSPRNVASPDLYITNERVIRGYSSVKDFIEKNPDVRLMEPHEMIVSQLLEIANAKAQALFARSIQSVPGYSMVWLTKPELRVMHDNPDPAIRQKAALIEKAQEDALRVGQWETLPYIQGVRFKSPIVDAASKLLAEDEIGALRVFDSIALNLRNTLFTIDGSAWTMQGFMTAVTDPITTIMGIRDLMLTSLLGEKYFFRFIASRPKMWEIANKAGLVTGREFGGKELEHFILGKIPVIGGIESRGFGAFLPTIRIMQFEALYDYERIARSLGLGSMPARTAFEVLKTVPAAAPILAATDIIHLSDDQKENIALTAGFAAALGITSRLGARALANKLAAHESKNAIKAAVTAAKVINRSSGVFNWEGSGITARQLAIERTIFARSPALVRNTVAMFQRALTDVGPEGLYARMYLVRMGIMAAFALAGLKYMLTGQMDSFDPDDPTSIFSPESFMRADLGELGRVSLSNPFLSLARALFYAERPDDVTRWRIEDWRPWIGVTDWYTARMSDLAAITSLPVQISKAARYLSTRAGAPAYSEPLGVSHYAILPVSMQPLFETGFVQERSELARQIAKGLSVLGLEEDPSYNRPNEIATALISSFIGINHSPESLGSEVKRIRLDAMNQVLGGSLRDRNNDGVVGWEDLNNEQKRIVRAYLSTNTYYNKLLERMSELEAERERAGFEPSMVSKYFDERDRILEWSEASIRALYEAYRAGNISLSQYREHKSRILQERSLKLDALQEAFSRISAGRRGTNESVIDYINRWEKPEDKAVSTYYAMIDLYTDKLTGEVDWKALDEARAQFLNTLPEDVRLYLERNAVRREYSPADRIIAAGEEYVRDYFDVIDSLWDSFKNYSPVMSRFSSRDEFEKWLQREAASAGMRPEDLLSQIILKVDKVLDMYYDFSEGLSQWIRFNDPMLDIYLTEIYGFTPINPITRSTRIASGLYSATYGKRLLEDYNISDNVELLRKTLYGDMPQWFIDLVTLMTVQDFENRFKRTYRSKFSKLWPLYELLTPEKYSQFK